MIEQRVRTANDNAGIEEERPLVTIPADRPDDAYARRGNLILPLRFARLMPAWGCRETRTSAAGPGETLTGTVARDRGVA